MALFAELVIPIVCFLFEVAVHAIVFIYLLLRAIFSSAYRLKLREHWNSSNKKRASILLGIGLYSAALVIALLFWVPVLSRSNEGARRDAPRGGALRFDYSPEEARELKDTKEIDELAGKAGNFIKRKLEERKQAE